MWVIVIVVTIFNAEVGKQQEFLMQSKHVYPTEAACMAAIPDMRDAAIQFRDDKGVSITQIYCQQEKAR